MENKPLYGVIRCFRLHGGPYCQHRYTKEELEHLKGMFGKRKTYVLFNNLNMLHDALAFDRLLKGAEGKF